MTTTTRKLTNAQLAEQIGQDLDYLSLWHDAAAREVTRVINVTIPLASAIRSGYVHALTDLGRGELEAGASDLHAIRERITCTLEADCLTSGSWAAMWDLLDAWSGQVTA